MAESVSYPQIPSTVWSGVWKILHDSPSRRIDDAVLAIELDVQRTAAKQYLKELQRLGLFNEDGSTSDLAKEWRQDGDNPDVIDKLLHKSYPLELRELAPPNNLDRDKIVRWFVSQGLGAGSAKNKAATYIRVATGVSSSDPKPTTGSNNKVSQSSAPIARNRKPRVSESSKAPSDQVPLKEDKADLHL